MKTWTICSIVYSGKYKIARFIISSRMADENDSSTNITSDNDDLNELLQSALDDFDKPLVLKKEERPQETTKEIEEEQIEKTLQKDFQDKFANLLLHDVDDSTFSNQMSNLLHEVTNEMKYVSENHNNEAIEDDTDTVNEAIDCLMQNIEQIKDNMKSEQLPDTFNMGFPMMDQMFQMLMSKDVLYPSLQNVKEKYPAWLDENRNKIDANELNRYSRQYNIIKQICVLFESERDSDNEEVKQNRFTELLTLLQEMTDLGQPPADFAESIPGIPSEMLGLGADPNNCNTM